MIKVRDKNAVVINSIEKTEAALAKVRGEKRE